MQNMMILECAQMRFQRSSTQRAGRCYKCIEDMLTGVRREVIAEDGCKDWMPGVECFTVPLEMESAFQVVRVCWLCTRIAQVRERRTS